MSRSRRLRLFFGFVGLMSLIMLSYYNLDMLQVKTEIVLQRQELRMQQLRETCDNLKETDATQRNRSINDLSDEDLDMFIVDDNHRVIYCLTPKVATTTWRRILLVLINSMPQSTNLMSLTPIALKSRYMLTRLNTFPRPEVKRKLEQYTKFMFVRDPFVRLISAYRDKLMVDSTLFASEGWRVLQKYRNQFDSPQKLKEMAASGIRPSFHNFIQYLIDPKTKQPFNPHWREMHRLCHPCTIQYDFIGHQETFQEDAEQLLKMLNLKDIKLPPAYRNMTDHDYLQGWFKPVSLEERRRLYQIYETDYKIFGYPKPVDLLN